MSRLSILIIGKLILQKLTSKMTYKFFTFLSNCNASFKETETHCEIPVGAQNILDSQNNPEQKANTNDVTIPGSNMHENTIVTKDSVILE